MPTLNLDLDFVDHPKVKRLIARTGHEGITCLLRLWSYAGKFHKLDGSLASYTDDEIEQFAGWHGVRGGFLQAILDVSLMDSNRSIHDWQDHAGHLAVYHERAKDMNKKRWDSAKESVKESVTNPIRTPSSDQSTSVQFSSVQNKKEKENYAASPPYVSQTRTQTWRHEDPEFYSECLSELVEAIEGWFPRQKSPRQKGLMAGQVVNTLNRVIRVHPKALVWIVENKMRIPERTNLWFAFVKTADKTMHDGGFFPDGNPCPPLCHEWASEARRACPLVPRLELKK